MENGELWNLEGAITFYIMKHKATCSFMVKNTNGT